MIVERIILVVLSGMAIVLLPWWVGMLIGLVGIIRNRWFFEGIGIGIIADVLYGYTGFPWLCTLLMTGLVLAGTVFHDHVRIYEAA